MADVNSNHLVTEVRESFGKGAARKIRSAGKIPAVIYGHGTAPQHVTLPGHEVALILRKSNQVLELEIQGKTQLALVKDVQKDPVRQIIEHVDLVVIRRGEKVQVEVAVHIEGEPASGTIASLDARSLTLEVLVTNIPENVVVDVEGQEAGFRVFAKDVTIPEGATLISDPEVLVVAVSVPQEQDLGEPDAVEDEDAAEDATETPAEGEDAAEAAAPEEAAE